jgi:hypothetical protein
MVGVRPRNPVTSGSRGRVAGCSIDVAMEASSRVPSAIGRVQHGLSNLM